MRFLLFFCLLVPHLPTHAEELTGYARVIDGDTLEIDGRRVRLEGIDAPEARQECERSNGRRYACGYESTAALRRQVRGRELYCKSTGRDQYGRLIATCFVGRTDVNGWMVKRGHAIAYRRYSRAYAGDESSAKIGRRGIWQGRFVEPAKWRRGERLGSRPKKR